MIAKTRLHRRITGALAAVVAGLTLSGCDLPGQGTSSGPTTGVAITPGQPVPVALLVPKGSANPAIQRLAQSLVDAGKLAAADAGGAQIDLRVYDTQGTAGTAASAAQTAVDNGAKIIIGPLFAEAANAAARAVADENVNVIAFSNNAEIAGGNLFVMGSTFDNVADRLIGYGKRRGKSRILLVAENDVAGQIAAKAIEGSVARNGVTLAGRANHAVSTSGIDKIVPQVAEIAKSRKADAIFMTANAEAVLPYLTDALYAQGVTSQTAQFMGLTRWDTPATRLALPGVQGGWFAIPETPLNTQFDARLKSVTGRAPHELAALSYDAVTAVASLAASGRRDALASTALTNPRGFKGVAGAFRFKPDRTNQRALAVATIRDKKVVVIDPAPQSFSSRSLF